MGVCENLLRGNFTPFIAFILGVVIIFKVVFSEVVVILEIVFILSISVPVGKFSASRTELALILIISTPTQCIGSATSYT